MTLRMITTCIISLPIYKNNTVIQYYCIIFAYIYIYIYYLTHHTICPRSSDPFHIVTLTKQNESLLLEHTVSSTNNFLFLKLMGLRYSELFLTPNKAPSGEYNNVFFCFRYLQLSQNSVGGYRKHLRQLPQTSAGN